jgi:N-acetylmuramoyl-L-alanine amidase
MKRTLIFLTILLVSLTLLIPSLPARAQSNPPGEDQIADFLNGLPLVADSGGEVLSVHYVGEVLVVDLSQEVLPGGVYDDTLFTTLQSELDSTFQINQRFMVTFKVEGLPLEDWGLPVPEFTETAEWPLDRELPGDGPLAGVKIALSAGHGLYWNETYNLWTYQRGEFWGIREDTLNSEIIQGLKAQLESQGATVIDTREMDKNARTGVTGYPAWHEDARQYGIYLGLPDSVWDGSNTNYNSDIRARPYMANYYDADLLISFHNNGWDGSLRGTETYWDHDNHPNSQALATAVHNQIISTLTTAYGSWTNRGIKISNDAYGEINYAQMPAALIELAFMDNLQDNTLLHTEAFRQHAIDAMSTGICNFLGADCDPAPVTLEAPSLNPAYAGMCDSGWYRYTNSREVPAYLTLNATDQAQSENVATWEPSLPNSGEYQIEVFIPAHNAINWSCPAQTVDWDTSTAKYTINDANGPQTVIVNQAAYSTQWVSLGNFHFNSSTDVSLTLTDVTGEAYLTTTVSASAARFTLVDYVGTDFYDIEFVPAAWSSDEVTATVDEIRNFLLLNHSCLADPIQDADDVEIDLPVLIQQAAATYQISPKLLLAIMEAQQGTLSACPDATALASLMGFAPSTARAQIESAASQLGTALSTLTNTGISPNGWSTGSAKLTLDGVTATPANQATTLLFDALQNAGVLWGGDSPGAVGVQDVYLAYRDYHLDRALPKAVEFRFIPLIVR